MVHKHTNALINETSPYLLQHAHNPVNWEAWGDKILKQAQREDKLLLISIGYASCHWCHVMEKECFEDEAVASVMNQHFINIKVDREERPDVDHIYMDALQMMTGSGGWPLNIVALPDGRPFWGATYVKKEQWIKVLENLADLYKTNPEKVIGYAKDLSEGIKSINLVPQQKTSDLFTIDQLEDAVKNWSGYFDNFLGGYKRAPKFMMPGNLNFLLHYATAQKDDEILDYVNVSLTRMAYGGIFDHVGGGFSRYSVDTKWHVPHFEKMLYDNGQMVSLYAKAYAVTKNDLYKKTVEETISFVTKELMNSDYGFFSSLDADSLNEEGILEEGAYYVWTEEELKELLTLDFPVFKDYYNINSYGHWEHGNYVLIRDEPDAKIAKKHKLDDTELQKTIKNGLKLLDVEREKRNRPRLDDKILTSWNGLMLRGLIDAYRYLGDKEYLDLALKNATFIRQKLIRPDGSMFHNHKAGKSTINGYLEDYAAVMDAYRQLYEVTFDEQWLQASKGLLDYCISNFLDSASGMFYFTSKKDDYIIRRTIETTDNVIPASNSIMAINLLKMSKFFPEDGYGKIAKQQLKNMQGNFTKNAQSYANWLHMVLYLNKPFYELAVVGDSYKEKAKKLLGNYLPHVVFAGAEKKGNLSLLQERYQENETLIYVCEHGSCRLPVSSADEALGQLQFNKNKQ
ncbi:thioredoxin domain-containing protein [Spongiimicrobium sp. 3-5]|uniref:thioredoxin domain-containing protein n=1 Tax=Spongiimicrobium sp. 3-5 TaxID=3332596 RepID=UPI003980F94D